MSGLAERARTRFVPALLTALGVTLLAAGLLSYTMPVTAEALPTASPSGTGSALATPAPRITLPPLASVGPSTRPSAPADRVATRVRVAALKIDLPVVKPGDANDYPLCDVAMWIGRARTARPGPRDVPLCPRPQGHVPAAPRRVPDQEGQEDAGHGRRGLDERRPAVPVRDRRGATASAEPRRRRWRRPRSSSGSRPRRGPRARPASSRSSPSRSRRRRPTTPPPIRSPSRSSAGDVPAG